MTERKFHHIELKSEGGSPLGRMTKLSIDGMPIRHFYGIKIECDSESVDLVTIAVYASVDITVDGHIVVKKNGEPDGV